MTLNEIADAHSKTPQLAAILADCDLRSVRYYDKRGALVTLKRKLREFNSTTRRFKGE